MTRPNLFANATSELSQDAFLAWLLAWADPSCGAEDPALHAVGRRFLEALFERANRPAPPASASVRVETQREKIDLLVIVDGRIAVVIEDKVHSGPHGNQLAVYRLVAQEVLGFAAEDILCIYLKTGDQIDTRRIADAGYSLFRRGQLLELLEEGLAAGVTSDIYRDFTEHIRGMEERVNAWRTTLLPIERPRSDLWKGLFTQLQDRLGRGGWGWVNNRAGGFFAFWWCEIQVEGGSIYLQADSWPRLRVRVWTKDRAQRRDMRVRWQARVGEHAQAAGMPFVRPKRPRAGETAEVARFDGSWLIAGDDGLVDLDATVERLIGVTEWLSGILGGDEG